MDRELIAGQDPYSAKAMGKAFVDKVLRAVPESGRQRVEIPVLATVGLVLVAVLLLRRRSLRR